MQSVSPALPNDPLFSDQWYLKQSSGEDINADTAWGYQKGNVNVRIGIIDTGVDYDNEDLGDGFGSTYKVKGGYDYYSGDSDPRDEFFHGTHVAGIAAALSNNYNSSGQREGIAGVAGGWDYNRQTGSGAKGAILYAFKVGGTGTGISTIDAIQAIHDAADPNVYNVDILNNSWGGYQYNESVREAVNFAARMNRIFVAAKGNDSTGDRHYPSDYDYSWVISVGATNQSGALAAYPDWGWPQNTGSNYGNGVDVVAPGTKILSTTPITLTSGMQLYGVSTHYDYLSGTSMATPQVTGLAALLLSEAEGLGITLHPDDVQGIIRASADDKGSPGYDAYFGAGRINAGKALERLHDPYVLVHETATGGSSVSTTGGYELIVNNSGG